jgi:DNA-binding MarR family transcriptional regulator
VLGTLLRSGPPYCLTPTELYRTLMISSGGLTDRLQRLKHARLVTRDVAPDDARSLQVRLTRTGKQTAEAAFRADMALEASLLAGLSRDERRTLGLLLRKLAAGVERLREPG